jgi:hypothetical protein
LTNLIPQNDAVDVALDRAGTPGHGESGGDGGLVAAESDDQGVQGWQVVGFNGSHPVVELCAVSGRHHRGEVADVSCGGSQFGAAGENGGEARPVLRCESTVLGHDPADDLAGFRYRRLCRDVRLLSGGCLTERV